MHYFSTFMKRYILHITLLLVATILVSCATVVKPDGGPRDLNPPTVLEIKPSSGTTQMTQKKIEIEFNEYVVLEKLSEQLVVSPPMSEKPKISIRGKKVLIELPDSLNPNTTYSIFFGNAIVNYKEKIPAENVEYVFSTGPLLDSLFIEGHVINAEDDSPAEKTFVMLYKGDKDSAIYKERPYYLARVRAGGYFKLSNLAEGSYQILALQDLNNNYIHDQFEEKLAFMDSLVEPYYYVKKKKMLIPDSVPTDSTVILDTVQVKEIEPPTPLRLSLFQPVPEIQMLVSHKTNYQNRARFVFRKPTGDIKLNPVGEEVAMDWSILKYGVQRDTLFVWFNELPNDTFDIEITEDNIVLDTVNLVFKSKDKAPLQVTTNVIPNMSFADQIQLHSANPVDLMDVARMNLVVHSEDKIDTLPISLSCLDKNLKMDYRIAYTLKEATKYELLIPDSSIVDIYGNKNDSLVLGFKTATEQAFGNLNLTITYSEEHPLFVELMKESKVISRFSVHADTVFSFPYLRPGKYALKAVVDRNENKKWDTGSEPNKVQPERVIHSKKKISVRSNWVIDHKWEVSL